MINLPETPLRRDLLTMFKAAEKAHGNPNANLCSRLGSVSTLHIIDKRLNGPDTHYRCDNYAFGDVFGFSWGRAGLFIPDLLEEGDVAPHLERVGFKPVHRIEQNDLVVYRGKKPTALHFAVIEEPARDPAAIVVSSKWGTGPIVRHPLPAVYPFYGDRADFYRLEQ